MIWVPRYVFGILTLPRDPLYLFVLASVVFLISERRPPLKRNRLLFSRLPQSQCNWSGLCLAGKHFGSFTLTKEVNFGLNRRTMLAAVLMIINHVRNGISNFLGGWTCKNLEDKENKPHSRKVHCVELGGQTKHIEWDANNCCVSSSLWRSCRKISRHKS